MKVIEKYNDSLHNPYWKYQLGTQSYEVRDTPKRVVAIKERLLADGRFELVTAHEFPERLIARLHPYHDFIRNMSESLAEGEEMYPDLFPGEGARLSKRMDSPLWGGLWCTDAVTPIAKKTYEVARASAETALTGASLILDHDERAVYSLCRPSGHHAGPRVFGGYCYFNNVATAAEYLLPHGSVAILDIDYHHGNGTQEFFEERKFIFTSSIHGDPNVEYPYYWGYAEETGIGQGEGTNLNLPLPLGSGGEAYLGAVDQFLEAMQTFEPDFLIIAAGFDTYREDPIGGFKLDLEDYNEIGRRLASLGRRTLICQEGGYNVEGLGGCVHAFLDGFIDGMG